MPLAIIYVYAKKTSRSYLASALVSLAVLAVIMNFMPVMMQQLVILSVIQRMLSWFDAYVGVQNSKLRVKVAYLYIHALNIFK